MWRRTRCSSSTRAAEAAWCSSSATAAPPQGTPASTSQPTWPWSARQETYTWPTDTATRASLSSPAPGRTCGSGAPRARARGSSASHTASRSIHADSSTWPIAKTRACRSSPQPASGAPSGCPAWAPTTVSTSGRCSRTARTYLPSVMMHNSTSSPYPKAAPSHFAHTQAALSLIAAASPGRMMRSCFPPRRARNQPPPLGARKGVIH
mmetsp:Transcript_35053/g.112927  ORF Transcript_35053/g.112927 Transcript_35053/m.112927 type:complete len:208 (-) Transcript_35053:200-823(-)